MSRSYVIFIVVINAKPHGCVTAAATSSASTPTVAPPPRWSRAAALSPWEARAAPQQQASSPVLTAWGAHCPNLGRPWGWPRVGTASLWTLMRGHKTPPGFCLSLWGGLLPGGSPRDQGLGRATGRGGCGLSAGQPEPAPAGTACHAAARCGRLLTASVHSRPASEPSSPVHRRGRRLRRSSEWLSHPAAPWQGRGRGGVCPSPGLMALPHVPALPPRVSFGGVPSKNVPEVVPPESVHPRIRSWREVSFCCVLHLFSASQGVPALTPGDWEREKPDPANSHRSVRERRRQHGQQTRDPGPPVRGDARAHQGCVPPTTRAETCRPCLGSSGLGGRQLWTTNSGVSSALAAPWSRWQCRARLLSGHARRRGDIPGSRLGDSGPPPPQCPGARARGTCRIGTRSPAWGPG